MAKVTTGAIVNEKTPTQEDMVQEWKRKISKGEYPFIYINQPLAQSEKR
ncbi:hypothetical protein ACT3XG_23610 [Paenibacillus polymyxa]|uniref:Uncharacterized protein n=1 Tax=Paenibacillus polymyxa TaxID=1406 RepID=A0A378Y4X8_PAEPO|nr:MULTISPECIES: hypothetical protein [Paenibacillus]AHM68429.1 hypothetical protein PPSQR21_048450 [Paenibacillus polymyxa SQR-21]AUS29084.1 hypothetical protein C1A50_4974 [Paenibacillus polymyxa]KAF6587153.1 hypothetical protein G9G57_01695 [Paenibacillus sp. EKM211P]KAF6621311.1 hypothetical protein HFE00_01280 [Paenibacillus sp. EKM101P]KAF6622615.1 hypothetical protein HFE03_10745 [Paenibacillus sp. EKM102P]